MYFLFHLSNIWDCKKHVQLIEKIKLKWSIPFVGTNRNLHYQIVLIYMYLRKNILFEFCSMLLLLFIKYCQHQIGLLQYWESAEGIKVQNLRFVNLPPPQSLSHMGSASQCITENPKYCCLSTVTLCLKNWMPSNIGIMYFRYLLARSVYST